jgi:phosphoribosylanthranilate isomerase
MRVKVCGIQTLEEANMCVNAGADAVGFLVGIVHKAEDKVTPQQAHDIIQKLPPFVSKVMVTHFTEPLDIIELAHITKVDTIQIHEDISIKAISNIRNALPNIKLIKAVHISGTEEDCIGKALNFEGQARTNLPLLRLVRQGMQGRHPQSRLQPCPGQ